MKHFAAAFGFLAILVSAPAHAGQAEARDVALSNNCPPKKIEVFQQSVGGGGSITYQVQCVLPKTVGTADNAAPMPDALLISCKQNMCDVLRPITLEKK